MSGQIAPLVNCVVTGAYWDKRYPRLLTNKQLLEFEKLKKNGYIRKGKMMSLADIVCDVKVPIINSLLLIVLIL